MRQRDGRIRINLLTDALEFVSITRSSTKVYSFVVETIDCSFLGSSWMQLIVKKFLVAQSDSESMFIKALITHLRFRLRTFKFPRHDQRTPRETSGRHSF